MTALLTDLYQITMSQGYFRAGMHDRRAVFHLFFRRAPFSGEYAVAAGLEPAIDWLTGLRMGDQQIDYLAALTGNDGAALFATDFLRFLRDTPITLDVDAMPEGTLAFAHQPLLRVTGPLWQCQWVETALLNMINFQTLIATKASRVCQAAGDDPVLEFGLRRAQGIDGGLAASRAAYVGGCAATSNVQAGLQFGIPVKGTHAHSWVMSFDDELTSFQAYADAMPNNCVFLVDTYDTIQGVRNAIEVGTAIRREGHQMVGIRLDSGDLSELSRQARKLLDQAGFESAAIVASNDLDEHEIQRLKNDGAKIALWGVGTNLVTAQDQPALGGVYKLAAIQDESGKWVPKVKLSEQEIKTSNPGIQQVRRFQRGDEMVGDIIYSELIGPPGDDAMGPQCSTTDLLIPVVRDGRRVHPSEPLSQIRGRVQAGLKSLPGQTKRIDCPKPYPVRLEQRLSQQKIALITAVDKGD
ncbi:MAG: nicotinate phosphoribosyltransferase [Planctomycetales bacterium]|nr:nicotinate phosphoribosyltransferase [Planctomycetales bacterium]